MTFWMCTTSIACSPGRYRLQPRQKLWEAHFHYTTANANARRFAKGHLKFPEAMGRDERLQRSDLRLDQIEDLIPFPAS